MGGLGYERVGCLFFEAHAMLGIFAFCVKQTFLLG